MPDTSTGPFRSPDEIEKDFADLLVSRLPVAAMSEQFEQLWDETNAAASTLVSTGLGPLYISLLKRMLEGFERHRAQFVTPHMNGFHRR